MAPSSLPSIIPNSVTLLINNVPATQVCNTDLVSWVYAGHPQNTIVFFIHNDEFHSEFPNASVPRKTEILKVIDGSLGFVGFLTWRVNVPPGVYMLSARVHARGASFKDFHSTPLGLVNQNNDTSCQISQSYTATSQPSGPCQAPTSLSTYSEVTLRTPSNIMVPSLIGRSTEINVARLTRSQLVGVIVGPIVFLVMIVSALVLLLRRRRRNGVNGEDSFLD